LSAQDALTAALLFLGLAAVFAFTRSHWLDDWDSVNFAFGLDDFDVTKHWPHPPGYPVYIAAGKLVYSVIADHAAALTLVSALSAASVASMFYVLERRHSDWPVALCATLIMALSPLFWLQSGLALTDMFGMVFVVGFLLVEGATTTTPRGALAKRIACGLIAGLSLGARPHITLLIVVYWCLRATWSRPIEVGHVLTAVLAFAVGIAVWLIPASIATGGPEIYWSATVGQFEWRFGRPGVSVLGTPITGEYLLARVLALIGSLGQAFGPMHLTTSHIAARGARAPHHRALCRLCLARRIEVDCTALSHRFGGLSVDVVHHAACAALALCLAAQPRHRLVGVRLPGSVPEILDSRYCARGAGCGHRVAIVLPGWGSEESPAAGCGSRLGQGKPSESDSLFRVAAAARGLLLA
jgi:hypothetical protein